MVPLLHISNRANESVGFVMRVSHDGLSDAALRHFFISLVSPHLEYASVIWSPYQKTHYELLDKIFLRFLKPL